MKRHSAIQDILVPELKAIRVELKHHGEEFVRIDKRIEALYQEMNKRFEAVDKRFDLFAESMHRLETAQEKILTRLVIHSLLVYCT